MATPATHERHRFADALTAAGPVAPTLCEGWNTRDLAAHVILRERRPDAAIGILVDALSGYTDKVQQQIAEGDWNELIEQVRSGPPIWFPARIDAVDRAMNTIEFFVHLEDVRRAAPDWEPRELDPELTDDLTASLRRATKMLLRKAPTGVTLVPDGSDEFVAKDGDPMVTLRGPIGELVLYLYGRQAQARVQLDGPPDAVAEFERTDLGL